MKKLLSAVMALGLALQLGTALAVDFDPYNIDFNYLQEVIHRNFASQYDYNEEAERKSFDLYPDVPYVTGPEKRPDGTEYELPAIYVDYHAISVGSYSLENMQGSLFINGVKSPITDRCVVYNQRTLVPLEAFAELGCQVSYDEETLVATITDGETVLEILPHLIGMRKNRAEGYYVPLDACARFVDGVLYVPARAVAQELNIQVGWDGENSIVSLDTPSENLA